MNRRYYYSRGWARALDLLVCGLTIATIHACAALQGSEGIEAKMIKAEPRTLSPSWREHIDEGCYAPIVVERRDFTWQKTSACE